MNKSINNNLPKDAIKGAKAGGKKEGGGNNIILIVIAVLAVLAVVIGLMTSGNKDEAKKPKEENVSVEGAASGTKGAKVYDNDAKRTIERSDPANANGLNGVSDIQAVNQNELVYKTDSTTGLLLVQTPSGFVDAGSPAGQKFIEDFNKMKAMQNPNGVNTAAAPQISQAQIDEMKQYNDSQIRALDEKINDLSGQLESSIQLVKKQNEVIVHLSTQIKSIQPIVKSPNELAKELFGKEGAKVLKSRNNSIKAEFVVGDKAFISDKNGNIHALKVGDIVPNTSSIVSSIDPSTKTVTVRH